MSASTHEAVLGGARWRLTLHPDGRWDVAKFSEEFRLWDEPTFAGTQGLTGMREGAKDLRAFAGLTGTVSAGAAVLEALADVAERSTTP